jgi:hypothetical protein
MSSAELAAVNHYINRMIADTQAAKMIWIKQSPTTFIWKKLDAGRPTAQLSLQKVTQRKLLAAAGGGPQAVQLVENYIFQALELPSGSVRLIVNTEINPDTRPLLKNLFDAISLTIDREGVNFLKQVMGS